MDRGYEKEERARGIKKERRKNNETTRSTQCESENEPWAGFPGEQGFV